MSKKKQKFAFLTVKWTVLITLKSAVWIIGSKNIQSNKQWSKQLTPSKVTVIYGHILYKDTVRRQNFGQGHKEYLI